MKRRSARRGKGATYLEAMTYRLWGHMMGDPEVYRTKEEVAQAWRERTRSSAWAGACRQLGYDADDLAALEAEAEEIIADALEFAQASPLPEPRKMP